MSCSPLFVTWSKISRFGDYRLRGCIGTLQPRHLHTALREYALTRWVQKLHKDYLGSPVRKAALQQSSCPNLCCQL